MTHNVNQGMIMRQPSIPNKRFFMFLEAMSMEIRLMIYGNSIWDRKNGNFYALVITNLIFRGKTVARFLVLEWELE